MKEPKKNDTLMSISAAVRMEECFIEKRGTVEQINRQIFYELKKTKEKGFYPFMKKWGSICLILPIAGIVIYLFVQPNLAFWMYFLLLIGLYLLLLIALYKLIVVLGKLGERQLQESGLTEEAYQLHIGWKEKSNHPSRDPIHSPLTEDLFDIEGMKSVFQELPPFPKSNYFNVYEQMKQELGDTSLQEFQSKIQKFNRRKVYIWGFTLLAIINVTTPSRITGITFSLLSIVLQVLVILLLAQFLFPKRTYTSLLIIHILPRFSHFYQSIGNPTMISKFRRSLYRKGLESKESRKWRLKLVMFMQPVSGIHKDRIFFVYDDRIGISEKAGIMYKLRPPEKASYWSPQTIISTESHTPDSQFRFLKEEDGRYIYTENGKIANMTIINDLKKISSPLAEKNIAHVIFYSSLEIIIYLPGFIDEKQPIKNNDLEYIVTRGDFITRFYEYTVAWRFSGSNINRSGK